MIHKNIKKRTSRATIWVTIYADMMTNLMLFFLMLFVMTRFGAASRGKMADSIASEFSGSKKDFSTAETERYRMTEEELTEEAKKIEGLMETNEKRIKFMLPGEILFDSASSKLKENAKNVLSDTVNFLKKVPNKFVIEGYTDDLPINTADFSSNWELSLARAENVMYYFIQKGIAPEQICIAGFGEYKPLVPNDSDKNRKKNRRIEITIIKDKEG
jgi:chemotaxis protein MotB